MRKWVDEAMGGAGVVLIALCLVFLIVPLVVSLVMSFDARSFLGRFPPPDFSLQWYERFLGDATYTRSLGNSLMLAVTAATFSVLFGLAAGIGIDRTRFPGRDVLLALFLSPLIVPGVVIGFSLLLLLAWFGIIDGFTRLVLGHLVITFPYVVRATLASLVGIGRSLDEAAMSLGADEWWVIWTVTLPLCRTGAVVGALFAFAISIDDVAVGIFLADPDSYTLPLTLVTMMRANFDLTIAAASAFLVALAVLLILVVELFIGVDRVIGHGMFRS